MSRFTHPTNGVVEPRELIVAARDCLRGASVFATALGSTTANIFAHRVPETKPSGAGWLVVREFAPMGGQTEQVSGLQQIRMQVMAECHDTQPNVDQWHSAIHNRVSETLLDSSWNPTLTTGDVAVPIRRISPATPARYDADTDSYYSVSEFAVVLAPSS